MSTGALFAAGVIHIVLTDAVFTAEVLFCQIKWGAGQGVCWKDVFEVSIKIFSWSSCEETQRDCETPQPQNLVFWLHSRPLLFWNLEVMENIPWQVTSMPMSCQVIEFVSVSMAYPSLWVLQLLWSGCNIFVCERDFVFKNLLHVLLQMLHSSWQG